MRIAVIQGGQSAEREVSLVTGGQIAAALESLGHEVKRFELNKELTKRLGSEGMDVVFPAVHGGLGEDGSLQGYLELIGMPYVGSAVLASALAMNKASAKTCFEAAGLRCAKGIVVHRSAGVEAATRHVHMELGDPPYMVKPNSEGSALGATRAFSEALLAEGLTTAFALADSVLVEQFIRGREMTVAVLDVDDGPRALPPIEILPAKAWYDYEARYTVGMSEHVCPPDVEQRLVEELEEAGVTAHMALGCRDYSRMDCLLTEDGRVFVLEVNTLPGMTPTSLFPDAARHAGIEFSQLVELLVNRAASRG